MIRKAALITAVTSMALLAGCAATQPAMDASRPADAQLRASLAAGIATPTIDANGHDMDPEVAKLFLDAFAQQAAKDGVRIVANGVPVKITVEEYNARSTAARLLLGVLVSGDHIKASVNVGVSSFVVEDSAKTTINGIGTVAKNVGFEAANGVATLAGQPVAN